MNKRIYNQTVTVYTPYRKPAPSTDCTFIRCVVPNCHWEENSIMVYRQTGSNVTANFEIIFPRGKDGEIPRQLAPEEWARLPFDDIAFLEQHYAFSLTGELDVFWKPPLVFRGILDYRFVWGASGAITTAMNNLARDYGTKAIRDFNYNWFGDRKLHHIAVR